MEIVSKIRITAVSIVLIYIVVGMLLFFNQNSISYYPNDQDFEGCLVFKEYDKKNYNGTRFYFRQGSQNKVIVYYHGNAGSACDRSYTKPLFEQSEASLMIVEYAGYSNDDRKPSKDLIFGDVENIKNYITEQSFQEIIVLGQSVGSGAASYHASLTHVDTLILIASFSKLIDVIQERIKIYPASVLFKENYDNVELLQKYENKLLILHGDKDFIIPYHFSQQLFESIPSSNKEYVLIEEKGHNNMWTSPLFQRKIIEYIGSIKEE